MLEGGFVKLYRSLLNWEWYDDINTKTVFLHLLLTVSIEDSKWHGITVKRGSRVSSYRKLAEETHLSVDKVRTAIEHLKSTNEVTHEPHTKYSVFSINNYDKFQSIPQQSYSNPTLVPHSSQQYKKVKESKEDNISFFLSENQPKNLSTVSTIPTLEEVKAYIEEIGSTVDAQRFYSTYTAQGWKTKSGSPITDWKSTVRHWQSTEGKFKTKPKSKSESIPESPMAEAYKSLVYNIDE